MIEVARRYKFHAAHRVKTLGAPWCDRHEHDYTVEVVASAPDHRDVVVDTDRLDACWRRVESRFAGAYLNATIGEPTTVEHLANWLFTSFDGIRGNSTAWRVTAVTVWEDNERWGRCTA